VQSFCSKGDDLSHVNSSDNRSVTAPTLQQPGSNGQTGTKSRKATQKADMNGSGMAPCLQRQEFQSEILGALSRKCMTYYLKGW